MARLHCPSRPIDTDDLIRRLKNPERDAKEYKALQTLVQEMIEAFQNEKRATYLVEAAQLASVTEEEQYKLLMLAFSNAIIHNTSDNNVLDTALLQAFVLALQSKGVLSAESHNLGATLNSLYKRLDFAPKAAEIEKVYHLICTLGVVLDAMVDIQVTGLDREWLHKSLLDLLRKLRENPEPRLAQAASYAYEALRGVPDNDGPWQALGRNAGAVISVLATVGGGVSKLDPASLIDAAPAVMELLSAFKTLVENGKQLRQESQSLKNAFTDTINGMQKPRQWYGALRYCRLLSEAGAFELLKQILPELPVDKEPFWCGLYSQLEQTWVANDGLKSKIEEFVEWMHCQESLKTAFKALPQIAQWRNFLAETMKRPDWKLSLSMSYRRHFYEFWKKRQCKPKLNLFCHQSNIPQSFTRELYPAAWQRCHQAHDYYADSRLVQYYTEQDRLQIRRISGDFLSLENCYINLSTVERSTELGKCCEGLETSLSARLKVETPDPIKELKLPDLFKQRGGQDGTERRSRRILIRGRAGVGKTTLCKKIIYEFCNGSIWSAHFDRIIWIPLRKLKASSTLQTFMENEFSAAVEDKTLLASGLWRLVFGGNNKRTLFLLDGFDEVAAEMNPGGRLVEDFQDLFKQANTIITSRPYAALVYVAGCDLELETIGFSPQQAIETKLWRKDMVSLGKKDQMGPLDESRARTYRLRKPFQRDAFFQWFPHWNDSMLGRLSFLRSPDPSSAHYFTHLIFQEFFAAAYFVQYWIEGKPLFIVEFDRVCRKELAPMELIQNEKYNMRYNVMWRFVSGLLSAQANLSKLIDFLRALDSEPRDLLGPRQLTLMMHCFHEIPVQMSDSKVNRIRSNLENHVSRLLCGTGMMQDDNKWFPVLFEAELPEHLLEQALQRTPVELRSNFLRIIANRDRISCGLLKIISTIVDDATELHQWGPACDILAEHAESARGDVLKIIRGQEPVKRRRFLVELTRCPPSSPGDIILALLEHEEDCDGDYLSNVFRDLLVDQNPNVIYIVSYGLRQQLPLTVEDWDSVLNLLNAENPAVRQSTAESIGYQSDLPPPIVQGLASVLANDVDEEETLTCIETCIQHEKSTARKHFVEVFCRHAPMSTKMRNHLECIVQNPGSGDFVDDARALSKYSNYTMDLLNELEFVPKQTKLVLPRHAVFCLEGVTTLPESVLAELIIYLEENDKEVAQSAANCIEAQRTLPSGIVQALILLLHYERAETRAEVVSALQSNVKVDKGSFNAIVPLLQDKSIKVRRYTVKALGESMYMSESVVSKLTLILDFPEDWDLSNAVYEVLLQNPKLPVDVLQALVRHLSHRHVRKNRILRAQVTLPATIVESLVNLLAPSRGTMSFWSWMVLSHREKFFSMLPDLSEERMLAFLSEWISIDLHGGIRCCYF
ncbi:uncharacterized protein BO97DRAFT_480255 [Aspergillus homomorphus CBS 101889]|uniref:NACHT domain-containing protein n=1 Tax=Aspergillus homomorphus (strain CBS 101889) TaxID=1450537 RepID=A0A395HMX1_ASPHC|nr:hypothetical protein BO97DRAFT_480255 [Aspergillus homomorphus CBS 101889]RAL09110.1 hypothetical protein BO97DRAFT_480255 [Aspergillus homomorphus CBS 101889]